ncbi:uncharacterized protein LOC128675499 isoform X2 [Plodia interpunctella]|uniref:uncharacterized protein LOC128675499 isoform X2 n=1 Tax=Plodia interpunctella TaxID=58824 RepID=UPI002367D137|nr:uncharacterized protein LOC128675499 isoform X2 [Plodia interpunctella]
MPSETTITISINTTRGIISGMIATLVTHPLDVLKIRRQISPNPHGSFRRAWRIYRDEGWRSFYCGLSAGLWRQVTNTATRMHKVEPPESTLIVLGIISSMAGGVVGNPSEMVLVRRMAEGCHFLTSAGQHTCEGAPRKTFDSLRKIVREEGFVGGLWRGCTLTLLRSAMVSVIHISLYECFKLRAFLEEKKFASDEHTLGLYTVTLAHLISALMTHPVDIVKSFYQLSKRKEDRPHMIMRHLLRTRGMIGLLRGFPPYFVRMTSHAIIKFYVMEII